MPLSPLGTLAHRARRCRRGVDVEGGLDAPPAPVRRAVRRMREGHDALGRRAGRRRL